MKKPIVPTEDEETIEEIQIDIANAVAEIDDIATELSTTVQIGGTAGNEIGRIPSAFEEPMPTEPQAVPITVFVPAVRVVEIMAVRAGANLAGTLTLDDVDRILTAYLDEYLTLPPAVDIEPIANHLLELQTGIRAEAQAAALEWPEVAQ